MAKDYASRTTSRAPKSNRVMPGWVWMVSGFLIGLFAAGLVYLSEYAKTLDSGSTPVQKVKTAKKAVVKKSRVELAKERSKEARPKFDFYTILPELEVLIPESETLSPKKQSQTTGASAADSGTYVLQAGSFRKPDQADALKARLALLGFDVTVETVTIKDNETWHRVRIGPYTDTKELEQARSRLRQNDFYTILVKLKQ